MYQRYEHAYMIKEKEAGLPGARTEFVYQPKVSSEHIVGNYWIRSIL